MNIKTLIHPEDVYAAFEHRNKLLRGEVSGYAAEKRYLNREGRIIWAKIAGALIRPTKKRAEEFRLIEDITGEKIARDQVNTLLEEIRRSYAELERFTSIASHDLKSPLNTISNFVALLSRQLKESDSENKELMKFIVDACQRMRSLIDDLLTYSHISKAAHHFEIVGCSEVLGDVLQNLKFDLESCGGQVSYGSDLPTVTGDRIQLSQLFQNLIGNAIKYRSEKTPVIRIKVEDTETEWVFSVADNGIGFQMDHAERIFSEFQRLHGQGEYSGTGLGLSICRAIVKRHGGRIWAESEPGEESIFHFTLLKIDKRDGEELSFPQTTEKVSEFKEAVH